MCPAAIAHIIATKAGLFSAVLTAFVIESYKRLSPETSSQMYVLMQQMSTQLSSFDTPFGMINSTYQPLLSVPATGEQPFEPSANDIRVNVLWFASLVFSLITASFGILIKQWLREYLAVTNPSPQARLRIRHFRYPELHRWKILEIAAVLPLLQQLSLALFFIGLCYFTESVQQSIGRTTLPLVAGWAFCFATVTILPLFFPRCPYKTTLLSRLLVSLHLWLARLLPRLSAWVSWKSYGVLVVASESVLTQLDKYIENRDEKQSIANDSKDLAILAEVDVIQSNDELLGTDIFDALQQIDNPSYSHIVDFVVSVLDQRVSFYNLASRGLEKYFPRSLSRVSYNAIFDILIYFMKTRDLDTLLEDYEYTRALVILCSPSRFTLPPSGMALFKPIFQDARTRRGLAEKLVHRCITHGETDDSKQNNYIQLLDRIVTMLDHSTVDLEVSLDVFEGGFDTCFCHTSDGSLPRFTVVENVSVSPWNADTMKVLMRVLDDAIQRTKTPLQAPEFVVTGHTHSQSSSDKRSEGRLSNALVGAYNLMLVVQASDDSLRQLRDIIVNCLRKEEHTLALLDAVRQIETPVFVRCFEMYNRPSSPFFEFWMESKDVGNLIGGVNELRAALQTNPVKPDHALRLFCLGIHLIPLSTNQEDTPKWRRLFAILIELAYHSFSRTAMYPSASVHFELEQEFSINAVAYYTTKLAQSQTIMVADCASAAAQCLTYMQLFDRPDYPIGKHFSKEDQSKWWLAFTAENCTYPEELVEFLATVYFASGRVDENELEWWRVTKLGLKERVQVALDAHTNTSPSTSAHSTNPALAMENANSNIVAYASETEKRRRRMLGAALRRQEQEKARGLRVLCIAPISLH
jgi:hypothetical protein